MQNTSPEATLSAQAEERGTIEDDRLVDNVRGNQTVWRMISAGARPERKREAMRCMAGAEWLKKRL